MVVVGCDGGDGVVAVIAGCGAGDDGDSGGGE